MGKVDHNKLRIDLMNGAVHAVAVYGLEGVTTRNIVENVDINEAYIYRYFEDRADLLTKAYIRSALEIAQAVNESFKKNMADTTVSSLERFRRVFYEYWDIMICDRERCLFFCRMNNSYYVREKDVYADIERNTEFLKQVSENIIDEVDKEMLFHHMISYCTDLSLSVVSGRREDTEKYREDAFKILYMSLNPFLKDKIV